MDQLLLNWYYNNARQLPWRENIDPYSVWLSEIILQQTRVNQGLPYYNSFVEKFPNLQSFANASEDEILKTWQGLGYYSRARNMHRCAQLVLNQHQSVFPEEISALKKLPGIGNYTAGAIASIAYGQKTPAIDGNLIRVCSRILGIYEPPYSRLMFDKIHSFVLELMVNSKPGDINQALMELGATLCLPKNPNCENCPISDHCYAFENKTQSELPLPKKRTIVKDLFMYFLIIEDDDTIYIEQRSSVGIWAKLYQLPLIESKSELPFPELFQAIATKTSSQNFTIVKISKPIIHKLTHRKIIASFITVNLGFEHKIPHVLLVKKTDLNKYPFPQLIADFFSKNHPS